MTGPAAARPSAQTVAAGHKRCLLVLGMHRSGTSAVTGILGRLGCELGSELLPPAADNVRGFHENRRIVQLHDAWLSAAQRWWYDPRPWPEPPAARAEELRRVLRRLLEEEFGAAALWACKDPRLCRLLPLWLPLLRELEVDVHALLVVRHPAAVAASLERRDGLPPALGYSLWCNYVLDSVRGSRSLPRGTIHYETFLADPAEALAQALAAARLHDLAERARSDRSAIEAAIDRNLCHHGSPSSGTSQKPACPWHALAYSIHEALLSPEPSFGPALASAAEELERRHRLASPYAAALEHALAAERAAHTRYRTRWRRRIRRVCSGVRQLPALLRLARGRPADGLSP